LFWRWAHKFERRRVGLVLECNQWRPPHVLDKIQWRRLKALLLHAYRQVPFYQKRFRDIGLDPHDIQNPSDFIRIPVLTRGDIQKHLAELKAVNLTSGLIRDATGGSTGNPITFYRDRRAELWLHKAACRFRKWIGYGANDKLALIWGMDRDFPPTYPPNERWLNSFNCSSIEIKAFIDEMLTWKPEAIRGYASSLFLVADWIKSSRVTAPTPRAIESSAEKLWPHQRAIIEDIFRCKVFDMYGSREIPSIACECEYHSGLHTFNDIRIVEIIRGDSPAKPGEEGSVIVTDLLNYAMPFIRYEIGDVGVMSKEVCRCGRGFPMLKEIKGRITNTIVTPDERYIHGEYFTHLFYDVPGIKAFQVRQYCIGGVDVSVEVRSGYDPAIMEERVARMRVHLGPQVRVKWNTVSTLPLTASGKRHFTISEVPICFASRD
jgi:phenylacetate-CoA ligase